MDETNPYQPPDSKPPNPFERKYAMRLLALRDKPLTLGVLYRMQSKKRVIGLIYSVLAIAYFVWVDLQPGIYLMLGALGGIMLDRFAMARMQIKLWPMQKKVLDWEKVERMADGEQFEE